MKYNDGQEVRLGDKLKIGDDWYGVVVCSMDTDEYTEAYPKEAWGYLKKGVLIQIKFKQGRTDLFHYEEADEFELLERAK